MATLQRLAARGDLERVEVELGAAQPFRLLYGSPRFIRWLGETAPQLKRDWHGRLSPDEQLYDLLRRFLSGGRLEYGHDLHELEPLEHDVWELKTTDVRIFGWFPGKCEFVAVSADLKKSIMDSGLYPGYRDEVVKFRDQLDLDEPKYQLGASYDDVL